MRGVNFDGIDPRDAGCVIDVNVKDNVVGCRLVVSMLRNGEPDYKKAPQKFVEMAVTCSTYHGRRIIASIQDKFAGHKVRVSAVRGLLKSVPLAAVD